MLYLDVFTHKVEQYLGDYYVVVAEIADRVEKEKRKNAQYEKEIRDKHEWIEKSEIRILISQGNRKEALDKAGSFFRKFGFKPVYIFELLIILTIGFPAFDKVRATCTNFYHKLCNKT